MRITERAEERLLRALDFARLRIMCISDFTEDVRLEREEDEEDEDEVELDTSEDEDVDASEEEELLVSCARTTPCKRTNEAATAADR